MCGLETHKTLSSRTYSVELLVILQFFSCLYTKRAGFAMSCVNCAIELHNEPVPPHKCRYTNIKKLKLFAGKNNKMAVPYAYCVESIFLQMNFKSSENLYSILDFFSNRN